MLLMHRVFPWCAGIAVSILGVSLLGQEVLSPHSPLSLRGTYAFTLGEVCVHQLSVNTPGFNSSLQLIDPKGAETYSGASNGLMVFDGFGGVTIQQGLATNIMNASNRLLPPLMTPIPLGFGLGAALPFTCTGTYSIQAAKSQGTQTTISLPLTCNAVIALPNALSTSGFQSEFTFEGILPQNTANLTLTDIGNTIQPVTIFFPGPPASSVMQQRICTRSATLSLVSPEPLPAH
jgi:hypothetical protein